MTTATAIPILVVDDNKDLARGVALVLSDLSSDIRTVFSAEEALEAMHERAAALVLTDVRMPGKDGFSLLSALRESYGDTRVILLTAFGTIESAVHAMRLGALDFVTKPFDNDELVAIVRRALKDIALEHEVRRLRAELAGKQTFCGMVSRDPRMLAMFETIKKVAPANATVLIRGESGTGKELVAKAIHETSGRKGRFVAFNAAALPESLAEAELFGAKKGAYTGAQQDRKGLFLTADQGTLFIDEVASMPLSLQGKLLRALQEHEIQPLGSDKTVSVDVRVVGAMNEDPARLMRDGRMRKDLYYRLAVMTLNVPALRERPDDIPLLAEHFLERLASPGASPKTVSPEARRMLLAHDWSGNVRELMNVVERAVLLSTGPEIRARDVVIESDAVELAPLPPPEARDAQPHAATPGGGGGRAAGAGGSGTRVPYEEAKRVAVEAFQRAYLEELLAEHHHNISAAAQAAGMTRAALHRIIRRLETGEDGT